MKAILLANSEITAVRSRKDRSASLSIVTGELTDEHRAVLFQLHGVNVKMLIESIDDPDNEPPVLVKSEKEAKSDSQRLYSVIFLQWKQGGEQGDFNVYYHHVMNKIIEQQKMKLDPM